jgi:hypothetical protein
MQISANKHGTRAGHLKSWPASLSASFGLLQYLMAVLPVDFRLPYAAHNRFTLNRARKKSVMN